MKINNAEKYIGEYVALSDYCEPDIITHNIDASVAYNEAIELGYVNPVIIYISDPETESLPTSMRYFQ